VRRAPALLIGLAVLAGTLALLRMRDDAPEADPQSVSVPAGSPVKAPDSTVPAGSPTWSAENIRELLPVLPRNSTAVSVPVPPQPVYDSALLLLARVVEKYAGNPDNAWAIAHGLLARGPQFRLTNQLEAVPSLFSVYAEPRAVGSFTLLGFPKERHGVPVEPHTDLLLKTLTEIGIPPDRPFPMGESQVTAADLYRYTLLKTFLRPAENQSNFAGPNDMAWGVQALAAWAPSRDLRWTALDGTPMDMNTLTDFLVVVLTKESKFLFDGMRTGQSFERKGQPLFSYACGGAHLLQGASYAVGRGFGKPENRAYVAAQGPLLLYRLPIELRLYDRAMARHKDERERLLVQRLKFLGHWLESMSKLQILGLFTPDSMQMKSIEGAAQNLALTVGELEKLGTFGRLDSLDKEDHQLFLDVVGDSSHAVRGLELALGRQQLGW
jgi:hypothetical protein